MFDDIHPLIEVEARADAINEVTGGAALGVVELHPNEVKCRCGNCITELCIGYLALGGRGDVKGTLRDQGKELSEPINHGRITKTTIVFNIKIKSINNHIAERTRPIV